MSCGGIEETIVGLLAGSALGPYLRVKLSGGALVVASGSEDELGTLANRTLAANEAVTVYPRGAAGVRYMVAASAFAQYAQLYAAADGKVDDSGTLTRGFALDAATAAGDIVRVACDQASLNGAIARSQITQEDLAAYTIPLTSLRVHDAMQTNLPGTAANDDMGLITGTPGTDAPTLQGVDFGGTSTDEKGAFEFVLPPEYVSGETITVRLRAAMLTTVSDGTATVDVECWAATANGAVGSDICATAAQSINSLTAADKDFTITPTSLVAGDRLIVRLSFGGSDSGNVGVMIPEISRVQVLLDIKG
jgi:hypothetical protein